MKQSFVRSGATLLLAVSLQGSGELTITPLGHAAVHVTDGRRALLVDFPYEAGEDFTSWTADIVPSGPKALCLVTHAHRDHFVPELAGQYCAALVGPKEVTRTAQPSWLEPGPNLEWEGIRIEAIPTPHGPAEHYSYAVHWQSARLFFSGDAQTPDALLRLRDLDVAFLTPGLLITVHKAGGKVDAGRIVSYHHRPADPVPNVLGRVRAVPGESLKVEVGSPVVRDPVAGGAGLWSRGVRCRRMCSR